MQVDMHESAVPVSVIGQPTLKRILPTGKALMIDARSPDHRSGDER